MTVTLVNPTLFRVYTRAKNGKLSPKDGRIATRGGVYAKLVFSVILLMAATAVTTVMSMQLDFTAFLLFGLYIVLGLLAVCVPLVILGALTHWLPFAACLLSVVTSLLCGAVLGYILAVAEFLVHGISLVAATVTLSVFFAVLILNGVLRKRIPHVFLRYLLLTVVAFAVSEGVLFLISRVMPDYAFLFDDSGFYAVHMIGAAVLSLWSVLVMMFHLSDFEEVLSFGVGKNNEWAMAVGLSELLIWVFCSIVQIVVLILVMLGGILTHRK